MANTGKITDLSQVSIDRTADLFEIVDVSANASKNSTINAALGITGNPLGDSDTQTVTNKTFTAPAINNPVLGGTLTGTYTIGGTPTFPATVVLTSGNQTINGTKTFTGLVASAPTITNATISADAITGFSTANAGTIYGISVSGGAFGTNALATNAVQANQLATNAITLGYTPITGNVTTTSASAAPATGLTATVTIPTGGRKVKVTAFARDIFASTTAIYQFSIWDGTVGIGTQIASILINNNASSGLTIPAICMAIVTPAAGSKTYNVGFLTTAGTLTIEAGATFPAFILVEVI